MPLKIFSEGGGGGGVEGCDSRCRNLGGFVRPASGKPYHISDQNM